MLGLTLHQISIMMFVKSWIHDTNTAVPKQQIVQHMVGNKVKTTTTLNAIKSLVTKGYIRRGYCEKATIAVYVMTRTI